MTWGRLHESIFKVFLLPLSNLKIKVPFVNCFGILMTLWIGRCHTEVEQLQDCKVSGIMHLKISIWIAATLHNSSYSATAKKIIQLKAIHTTYASHLSQQKLTMRYVARCFTIFKRQSILVVRYYVCTVDVFVQSGRDLMSQELRLREEVIHV